MKKLLSIFVCALLAACSSDGNSPSASMSGEGSTGGSMARFTISGDYLYTVDVNTLNTVDITTPDKPFHVAPTIWLSRSTGDVETIFALDKKLYLGTRTGMYIFDISTPDKPAQKSFAGHFRSYDPVVVSGNYAYVTLSAINSWGINQLICYDVTNPANPRELCTVDMTAPRGLGIDAAQNLLFVCDGGSISSWDISDPTDITYKHGTSSITEVRSLDAYDCIVDNGWILVAGADGIYQLGYDGDGAFSFISKIGIEP